MINRNLQNIFLVFFYTFSSDLYMQTMISEKLKKISNILSSIENNFQLIFTCKISRLRKTKSNNCFYYVFFYLDSDPELN